jgi:hypothetical protein
MSWEKFDDDCEGCRPVILDIDTRRPLPDDHPAMQKIRAIWATTSFQQREAFHNVMCLNSRDPLELTLVKQITDQLF